MPGGVPALTGPVDMSVPGARPSMRALPFRLPRRLRDPDLVVPAALGLILLATAFEALMLVLEMALGGDDRPFHLLAMAGLAVILGAGVASAPLLGRRIAHLAQL